MCMKGGAVTGGGVPGVTMSPSVFCLAFTQTGQSVPDAAGLKGSVQEGARGEFTTSNAQVALEKSVFSSFTRVQRCERVFFIPLGRAQSLYLLSAQFFRRSRKGGSDREAQHFHFPPCCAPCCVAL